MKGYRLGTSSYGEESQLLQDSSAQATPSPENPGRENHPQRHQGQLTPSHSCFNARGTPQPQFPREKPYLRKFQCLPGRSQTDKMNSSSSEYLRSHQPASHKPISYMKMKSSSDGEALGERALPEDPLIRPSTVMARIESPTSENAKRPENSVDERLNQWGQLQEIRNQADRRF